MDATELKLFENIHAALEEISIYIYKPMMLNRQRMLTAIEDIGKTLKTLTDKSNTMWNILYDQVLEREYEFTLNRLHDSFAQAIQCGLMPVKLHIYARHLDTLYVGTEFLVKDHPDRPHIMIANHRIFIVLKPENTPAPFLGASFECIKLRLAEHEAPRG